MFKNKFIKILSFTFISFTLVNLSGCIQEPQEPTSPLCLFKSAIFDINSHTLNTQIACKNIDKAKGLMNITSLPKDNGMIFVFANEDTQAFWMKDTLIDLSIAFIDSNWTIVDIQEMKANDVTPIYSKKKALYAIEANKNWFSEHDIKVGSHVTVK